MVFRTGRLQDYLERRRDRIRETREHERRFRRWLEEHPGGSYAQFYVENARRRISAGEMHTTLGETTIDQAAARSRARRLLGDFKRAGCVPHHVVVDYGCGSLWVGEAFMEYLDPGNYVGLDVSDHFYAEGLARMSAEFVAARRPNLYVIDDDALREVRAMRPDYIFSTAVLFHVPPGDLAAFLARVVSLAGPDTRIEMGHPVGLRTGIRTPRTWRHSRHAIKSALAPLGCEADYRSDTRIIRSLPSFGIRRR